MRRVMIVMALIVALVGCSNPSNSGGGGGGAASQAPASLDRGNY